MPTNGHPNKSRFPEPTDANAPAEPEGPEAAKRLFEHLAEFREYFAYLSAVKAESFKLQIKSAIAAAVLGIVGLLAASAFIFVAAWQVLYGIAGGLGEALEKEWLGNLITGAVFLSVIAGGVYFGVNRWKSAAAEATIEKYEQRKRRQKSQFGRDVAEAASERRPG